MASDQIWGSLVKAMTKKIEIPRIGNSTAAPAPVSPYRPAPGSEFGTSSDGDRRVKTGRRSSDPVVSDRRQSAPHGAATTVRTQAPTGASVSSSSECIQRIAAHLGDVSAQQVEDYLARHGGANGVIAQRLLALGLAEPDTAPVAAGFWWRVVSQGSCPPELMAELVRSAPGFPEVGTSSLFDHLLDQDAAPYREVKAAAQTALEEATPLLSVLVASGSVTQARAADISAEFYGLKRRRGKKWRPDAGQAATISLDFARAFTVVPVSREDDDRTLHLVTTRHPGPVVSESLGQITGRPIDFLIDTEDGWAQLLADWERDIDAARSARSSRSPSRSTGRVRSPVFRFDQDSFAGISYVPEMVHAILERATSVGATDIHLEPQGDRMRVRYRLDGILHDVANLRLNMGEDTISRIKVMADMDITERRKPQDGHVHQELDGRPYDFRIATVPTSRGERMSIRITAASKEIPSLLNLGLSEDEEEMLRDFTRRSHGIVLVCGPVGSGKTTTLYASLGELDSQQRNIMTIEDPVEIELPDVSQVGVNYKIGMDFSSGLRALLRQDPNIILVGEIRDDETAKVAVRGSLTGLLVFSSIHANSAPGAVTTLYNFDIPPFLLATSIVGVVAQRLVRTICPHCREEYTPDKALLEQAGIDPGEGDDAVTFFRGRGCDACYGTGYRGRTGIFEILNATEEMRQGISERAPEALIRDMAVEGGMRSLADSGRELVVRGETTVEEFIRVLYQ